MAAIICLSPGVCNSYYVCNKLALGTSHLTGAAGEANGPLPLFSLENPRVRKP